MLRTSLVLALLTAACSGTGHSRGHHHHKPDAHPRGGHEAPKKHHDTPHHDRPRHEHPHHDEHPRHDRPHHVRPSTEQGSKPATRREPSGHETPPPPAPRAIDAGAAADDGGIEIFTP